MEFEILNSTTIPRVPPSVDDHIGAESYVQYFKTDSEGFDCINYSHNSYLARNTEKYSSFEANKDYPPPIPSLVRTMNQPYTQLPWVMKRYHTDDGRLVIKQEKAEVRLEYFEAHRSDGRLVLNLIHVDDDVAADDGYEGDDDIMFAMDGDGDGVDEDGGQMAEKEEGFVAEAGFGGGGMVVPETVVAAPMETV